MNTTEKEQPSVSRNIYNSLVDVLTNCVNSIVDLASKHGINNSNKYTNLNMKHSESDVSENQYRQLCKTYETACKDLADLADGKTECLGSNDDTNVNATEHRTEHTEPKTDDTVAPEKQTACDESVQAESDETANSETSESCENQLKDDETNNEGHDVTDNVPENDVINTEEILPIEQMSVPEDFLNIDVDAVNTMCEEILDFLSDRDFLQNLCGIDNVELVNPVIRFTDDVKRGKYDNIDGERYQQTVKNIEELSKNIWHGESSISISKNEIIEATQKLMESAETLYKFQKIMDAVNSFNQMFFTIS